MTTSVRDLKAENPFPLMPFTEVADPDFFGDEMVRKSHSEEIKEEVEEGGYLFLLDESVERFTVDRRIIELVEAIHPMTTVHKVILDEYFLFGKTVKEVAKIIAKTTPETVSHHDIEMMIRWSISEMEKK